MVSTKYPAYWKVVVYYYLTLRSSNSALTLLFFKCHSRFCFPLCLSWGPIFFSNPPHPHKPPTHLPLSVFILRPNNFFLTLHILTSHPQSCLHLCLSWGPIIMLYLFFICPNLFLTVLRTSGYYLYMEVIFYYLDFVLRPNNSALIPPAPPSQHLFVCPSYIYP